MAVGPERSKWRTLDPQRLVVAITRNETTTTALLDAAAAALSDTRIQIVFTVAEDRSAFALDLEASLRARGLLVAPWDQVRDLQVDLVLAASHAGAPIDLDAPLLILPHGYARTRDPHPPVPAAPRVRRGCTVHATPHASGAAYLPDGDEVAVVGDPILDSLLSWRARTEEVRDALAVAPHQRLVVVSTTWRSNSLFATRPGVFEELLADLPVDSYAVAAILHPNIWTGHGRWQTRTWLRQATAAGLRLVPFETGWRPTIAAADLVIGDHGSVTFYADLLGKRVGRSFGSLDELTPGTVLAKQVASGPRLQFGGPGAHSLRRQIEGVAEPAPVAVASLVARAVEYVGRSHARLREVIYAMLDLDGVPQPDVVGPDPLPLAEWNTPTAFWVHLEPQLVGRTETERARGSQSTGWSLVRTSLPPRSAGVDGPAATLAVRLRHAAQANAERASILICERGGDSDVLAETLDEYPGAACAVRALYVIADQGLENSGDVRQVVATMLRGCAIRRFAVRGHDADDTLVLTSVALIVLGSAAEGPRAEETRQVACGPASWDVVELFYEPG